MTFRIDPRMWISEPFVDCPKCGRPEYGSLQISNNRWTHRCRACWHTATESLPPVERHAIYLDQMALSNMAKALDPVWKAKRGEQDPYWGDLFRKLERLVKLQVLTCPSSPIHDEESAVTEYADVLRRLREYLAGGISLRYSTQVHASQLYGGLTAFEAGRPATLADYLRTGLPSIADGRLDQWSDRIQLSVNFPTSVETVDSYRSTRDKIGEVLAAWWEVWRANPRPFEESYEAERRALYQTWIDIFNANARQFQAMQRGEVPFDPDIAFPPPAVGTLSGLLSHFQRHGLTRQQANERLLAFLESEAALGAPANDINALLMAGLARKAMSGQRKPPGRGTGNDLQAIASYLPYCDAMFVDNQFAGLMREQPLATKLARYKARVFSIRTRDEFLDYLAELEAAVPEDHVARVRTVYGDTWLAPFDTILEAERERRRGEGSASDRPPTMDIQGDRSVDTTDSR